MDRMLVVAFDTEDQAYKGKKALLDLDKEGSIAVYGYVVLVKKPDGTTTVVEQDNQGPLSALIGTSLGSLVGLLAGPAGLAVGASLGMIAGSDADLDNARIGADFLDDVKKELTPGKCAVVAEIKEGWTTPVDERMTAIKGVVFRRGLAEVTETANDHVLAAMKADVAEFRSELAQAEANRKAKIQEKITHLETKIQARLDNSKKRRQAALAEDKAKVDLLKTRASQIRQKTTTTHA